MPLYEYHCPACGSQFEVSRPVSRMNDPVNCPADGETALRLFSLSAGIVLSRERSLPSPQAPGPPGGGPASWSHFGHSHGMGAAGHSHGGPPAPSTDDGG